MAGTKAGAAKAVIKTKEKHGEDFYKKIGKTGGKHSMNGGFASEKIGEDGLTGPERARVAGYKGGVISKRQFNG